MRNYAYEVSACYEGAELVCKTNDVYEALRFVRDRWNEECGKVDLIDGYTGEVLLHSNDDDPLYMTPAMDLMWLGFLMKSEGLAEE